MPRLTEAEQCITERLKQRYKEAKERDRGQFDPTSYPEKASELELGWEPDPPLPAKKEPAASFAPAIPAALQAFDAVRYLVGMNRLDARSLSFLHEGNAIEEITNIDCADLENAIPGKGHAGAFLKSQQIGAQRRLLTLEDICRWQSMLAEEQLRFGHDLPKQGIGRLRSLEVPFNLREAAYLPDGQLLERTSSSGPTDIYIGSGGRAQCDWRELIKVQQDWHAALEDRRTQEVANV